MSLISRSDNLKISFLLSIISTGCEIGNAANTNKDVSKIRILAQCFF